MQENHFSALHFDQFLNSVSQIFRSEVLCYNLNVDTFGPLIFAEQAQQVNYSINNESTAVNHCLYQSFLFKLQKYHNLIWCIRNYWSKICACNT